MIRAVVFDLGRTLASGEGVITEPARILGVDPERFEELYWAGRRDYDEGASDAEYWTPILTGLGKPATPETIQHLASLDASLWLSLRPEARRLLADVRAAGRLVAVLSNAPFSLDCALLSFRDAGAADYWFISASMGVVKPNGAAYDRVVDVLEIEPAEIAFIDDVPANVAAAERAGWRAHPWTSDADSRAWLASLGAVEA